MNIVELIQGQLDRGPLSSVAGLLGMDSGDARRATDAAVPTMLAGLTGLASTPDGARKLDAAVDGIDDREDLSSSLSSGGARTIDKGQSMLSSLLGGGMVSNIASAVGKFTGMGSGQITSLLGALAPIVLGTLKGQKRSLGLDSSGLANMLASQKANIAGAMPAGLSSALSGVPGLSGLTDRVRDAGQKATTAASGAADWAQETGARATDRTREVAGTAYAVRDSASPSAARWAIPVLAILALGAGLWWWSASDRPRNDQARMTTPDTADSGAAVDPAAREPSTPGATGAASGAGAVGEEEEATLAAARSAPDDETADVRANMNDTFASATKTFGGITDAASAERAIPALKALPAQLESLQSGLSAVPANSRTTLMATLQSSTQTLSTGIDKAMANPAVAEKIRPYVAPIQAQLKALAPTTQPAPGAAAGG